MIEKPTRFEQGLPSMTRQKKYVDKDVWALTQERYDVIFERHDVVSIMFSGGKDSTACLHTAIEAAKRHNYGPIDAVFFDEEAISPHTVDYMAEVAAMPEVNLRWCCVPIHSNNACSPREPFWYPWDPALREKWCRELPTETHGIPMLEGEHRPGDSGVIHPTLGPGFDKHQHLECSVWLYPQRELKHALILGLRASESLRRHRAVASRTEDNYLAKDQIAPWVTIAKPIYDWTDEDVWTGPAKYGWNYNKSYDVMRTAGIPVHNQRVCPPFHMEAVPQLWMYAEAWPELWEKMSQRVLGANTARMYGASPAYASNGGQRPDASLGETWESLIKRNLAKWPSEVRSAIAYRIKGEVRQHFQKTREPIPEVGSHPKSGISWSFLNMIAVKGDLKGRKTSVDRARAASRRGS